MAASWTRMWAPSSKESTCLMSFSYVSIKKAWFWDSTAACWKISWPCAVWKPIQYRRSQSLNWWTTDISFSYSPLFSSSEVRSLMKNSSTLSISPYASPSDSMALSSFPSLISHRPRLVISPWRMDFHVSLSAKERTSSFTIIPRPLLIES